MCQGADRHGIEKEYVEKRGLNMLEILYEEYLTKLLSVWPFEII